MIYVTGDVHGGFDMGKLRELDGCAGLPAVVPEGAAGSPAGDGRDAPRLAEVPAPSAGDYLIVCGDFGFPWDFSDEECADIGWLESRPYTVLFVDGNHECFGHWAERPMESWHGGLVQRLAAFFEELEARLSYRHWYFGHFHRDRAIDVRHTVLYQAVVPLGATVADERGE